MRRTLLFVAAFIVAGAVAGWLAFSSRDPRPAGVRGIRRRRPPATRVLSREEAVLLACDALPNVAALPHGLVRGTALRVLLLTGLRRGELLALQDRDVDLVKQVVTVRCGKFGKAVTVVTP